MTCIYCCGETDTSGACVAQCYWSQNKRFESSNSAPVGWICPVCGRGLSPYTSVCPCYVPKIYTGNASNAIFYKPPVLPEPPESEG